MYLKSLTLRGFKSFASATRLDLEPGITCVVGPNGSGKSNVVDALAWVMGEQGAKNLRGGKMEDVIFAGTSGRQALGRAEVALTIDNTDGAIPIEYTEVTIARTLFRSGGSEYSVNGAPARLLDIQELLNDSGLGKEMHVIVGQGRLDAILHADPDERRGFIEEAAGVLKHRRRKDKALRKLTGLQTNLDRLSDLRAELSRQLGPLGRQAKAAKRAAVVQATLRDTAARLLADDIATAQAGLAAAGGGDAAAAQASAGDELEATIARLDEEIAATQSALSDHEETTEAIRSRAHTAGTSATRAEALAQRAGDRVGYLRQAPPERTGPESPEALRERAERSAGELAEVNAEVESLGAGLARLQESRTQAQQELQGEEESIAAQRRRTAARLKERAGLQSSREVAQKTLEDAHAALAILDEEEPGLATKIAQAEERLAEAQRSARESESGESELDEAHEAALARLAALETADAEVKRRLDEVTSELGQARARAEALRMGARPSAEIADIIAAGITGVRGAVGERLRIAPGWETAVTAVLDRFAQAVLVEDAASAVAVLEHLGPEALVEIAVAAQAPAGEAGTPADAAPSGGPARALASDSGDPPDPATGASVPVRSLVSSPDPGLDALLNRLLAGVRTAPDLPAAVTAVDGGSDGAEASDAPGLIVVTPAGEVVSSSRVGRVGTEEGSRAAARAALTDTEDAIAALESTTEDLEEQIAAAQPEIAAARDAVAQALAALHDSDAAIMAAGDVLSRAAETLETLRARTAQIADERTRLRSDAEAAEARLGSAEEALAENSADVDAEPDTTDRDRLAEQVRALGDEVMEARIAVRGAEDRASFLSDRVASLRRRADEEQRARERAERAAARRRTAAESAEALAGLAGELAVHLRGLEAAAQEELESSRSERGRLGEALERARKHRAQAAEEHAELVKAEHEAQLRRERSRIHLEELERRAKAEIGLSADHLVEQFGPHLPVPTAGGDAGAPADSGTDDAGTDDDDESSAPAGVPFVRAEVERAHAAAERSLKSIGTVNPLALEEYAALTERHDFLEKQITDIQDSRRDLMGLVRDVDRHVEEVFTAAFADTQREFADIFSRLFPGGEGSLTLTDPDDMLATGVDIHARPAGKKVKRLSLLSGGERSLVAVAMLVAIFKARPSPFYVMDEVEAALDDVNLSRLLTVFTELQETSQLIVITHQKRTMEIADALYGVTMGGDGISKVISQRIHRSG